MGVIFLALLTGGFVAEGDPLPLWVIVSAASAISLGAYSGQWRIMRTLGRPGRVDRPGVRSQTDHPRLRGLGPGRARVRDDHLHDAHDHHGGDGCRRHEALLGRCGWGVATLLIVVAWVLTFPMAGLMAAGFWGVLHLF